ncbi:tRNA CCA-pyrophosphorylase [Listeria fleischmannii subsp. fleischmannii LU2006-1]|nr:tRNA CCA-pyrophosphorylase [Listeria fleischmannii subsp. fleischmannii LU2006-1]
MKPLFKQAVPVLNQLEQAGYEAYFVGGSVRDLLLNREIDDIDIATSAFPEEVKKTFFR